MPGQRTAKHELASARRPVPLLPAGGGRANIRAQTRNTWEYCEGSVCFLQAKVVAAANFLKEPGNAAYKAKRYSEAFAFYHASTELWDRDVAVVTNMSAAPVRGCWIL